MTGKRSQTITRKVGASRNGTDILFSGLSFSSSFTKMTRTPTHTDEIQKFKFIDIPETVLPSHSINADFKA